MTTQIAITAGGAQHSVEGLEWRFDQAQEALAGAMASYHQLRELPHASERQLRQAVQRVQNLERQLAALQDAIEAEED